MCSRCFAVCRRDACVPGDKELCWEGGALPPLPPSSWPCCEEEEALQGCERGGGACDPLAWGRFFWTEPLLPGSAHAAGAESSLRAPHCPRVLSPLCERLALCPPPQIQLQAHQPG